jgi:epoxyqueuosine reductase QueG
MHQTQRRDWIVQAIHAICREPENALGTQPEEPAWGEPLVGFASGADPVFSAYKHHVGPEHWTPYEIFHATFPDAAAKPEELAVVAWVLPQTQRTKADNRRQTRMPAERWARARIAGETFNNHLRTALAGMLTEADLPAVAPMCSPEWRRTDSEAFTYASTWSERHAAYAAGLGTFGLCDGLITPVGKAMRVGSVVVRARVPATPRPYEHHQEYCLHFSEGSCGECIPRCPAGAISEAGHDKLKCGAYVNATREYVRREFGFEGYGCGLCQTGVACESGIPPRSSPR